MGAKYTTNTITGYNSSPPPDDGSQSASNLVTWAKHKDKLGDPLKTLAEAIDTDLVAAFNYAVRQITNNDSTVAGDHMRVVEIAPNVSTAVTVTLGDAATMTNVYRVYVSNSSTIAQTIARTTASDTINGVASNLTIPSKSTFCLQTTTGADGYLVLGAYPFDAVNGTEETAPADSDLLPIYDLSTGKPKFCAVYRFLPDATTTTEGKVELLTQTELNAGSDTSRVPTAAILNAYVRPSTLNYVTSTSSDVDGTSYTFSGTSIGTAAYGRYIHITVHGTAAASAVSVGGVTAELNVTGTNGAGHCSIWTAYLPVGTTADIVVTIASSLFCAIGVHNSTGLPHGKFYDTGTSTADPGTDTLTTRENGFVISGWTRNASDSITWTNATERYDATTAESRSYSGASATNVAAGTVAPSADMTAATDAVTVFATF